MSSEKNYLNDSYKGKKLKNYSRDEFLLVESLYVPLIIANSINCLFFNSSSPSLRIQNSENVPFWVYPNTPQAKCDVHRIDVNAINNEKVTVAVYRILGMCDVHRI